MLSKAKVFDRDPIPDAVDRVTFFPNWRGDSYLPRLASALADQGWECKIVGRAGLAVALIHAIMGNGTVHLHWFEGFSPKRRRIEGVIAWMYVPLLWLAGRRGRLVWTVHNLVPHEGYSPFVGADFVAALARSSSRIIVHFGSTRDAIADKFGAHDKVGITTPASFGWVHGPRVERSAARSQVWDGLDAEAQLFVQIGSLRPYKDPVTTVHAFRDAAPDSAKLLIAGPCNDEAIKDEILRAIGDDSRIAVRFGRLTDVELVAALCAADWSICPYLAIENPGAVNVSVAYNCPLIAPDFPAVSTLAKGHCSILYTRTGPTRERLAAAIAAASSRPARGSSSDDPRAELDWHEQAKQTAKQYMLARVR